MELCEDKCFAESGIITDSLKFWPGVAKHNNVKDIYAYALISLIIPASNAIVERIFSLVTAIKTKSRIKIQIKLLDALIRILSHLLGNTICCKDYECAANMLKVPNSVDQYGQNESNSTNDDETEYLEDVLHQLESIVNKM